MPTAGQLADGAYLRRAVRRDRPAGERAARHAGGLRPGPGRLAAGGAGRSGGAGQPHELWSRRSIFTSDLSAANRFVRHVRAGLVHVNPQTAGAEVHVPFGGHALSGDGTREQGREAYASYTEDRTVYLDPST